MTKDTEGSSHSEGDPGYQEILRTKGNFIRSLPPWQVPPSPSGNDQASMCQKIPG